MVMTSCMYSPTQPDSALQLIDGSRTRPVPLLGRGEAPIMSSTDDEQDHTIPCALYPPEPRGMGAVAVLMTFLVVWFGSALV
jgi:hypothetical protein